MYEDVEQIISTPKPQNTKERIIVFAIGLLLITAPFISGILVYIFYDWFFAVAAFLLGYIIVGIISSKLRNQSVPPTQLEHRYTSFEIAAWWYLS